MEHTGGPFIEKVIADMDILDSINHGVEILVKSRDLLTFLGGSFEPAWEAGEENEVFDQLEEVDNLIWKIITDAQASKSDDSTGRVKKAQNDILPLLNWSR